jgi:hypothetical protein
VGGGVPTHPKASVYTGQCETDENGIYEGVSKSFRTGHLEREMQMVWLSAIRCSCVTIL